MATVLLIDDDPDLVELNRMELVKRGFQVEAAYSAAQAREMLAEALPDLMVLDIMMESDTAGFELAMEISEKYPKVPTLILSTMNKEEYAQFRWRGDESWIPSRKFLDKPITPQALADEVDAALKK